MLHNWWLILLIFLRLFCQCDNSGCSYNSLWKCTQKICLDWMFTLEKTYYCQQSSVGPDSYRNNAVNWRLFWISVVCSVGSFHEENSLECKLCGKGSYQDKEGQTSCEICGNEMTTLRHGTADSDGCIMSKIASKYLKHKVMILALGWMWHFTAREAKHDESCYVVDRRWPF